MKTRFAAAIAILAAAGIALLVQSRAGGPAPPPTLQAREGSREAAALLAPRAPAARFAGSVHHQGAPVAGAEVIAVPIIEQEAAGCDRISLRVESLRLQTEPLARGQTAADGSFEIEAGPPFRVIALAPARGLVGHAEVAIGAGDAIDVPVAPGQMVRGTLLDRAGGRVAGTAVFAASGGMVLASAADEGGGFAVGPLPAGPVVAAARSGELVAVADARGEGVGLVLAPATRLQVAVRRGGAPVPGAAVELATASCSSAAVSNAAGEAWFEEVVRQPVRLLASERGSAAALDVLVDEPVERVVLALQPAVALEGRVRSESGKPVAGARVVLGPPAGADESPRPPTAYRRIEVVTGADGRFAVPALAVGPYEVSARADGFAPLRLPPRLFGAGTSELDLVLAAGAAIRGRVSGGSGAVTIEAWEVDLASRAALNATPAAAVTAGPDGSFELAGLARAAYTVRAVGGGGWHQPVVAVAPKDGVAIELAPAASVAGRVTDESGGPVAGAAVRIRSVATRPGTMFDRRVAAGEDGAFSIDGLPPGDYDVSAEAGSGDAVRRTAQYLQIGEVREVEVALRLAGQATLAGRLRDSSGEPVRGAAVAAFSAAIEEHPPIVLYTHTDGDGRFAFRHIEDEAWLVSARDERGAKSRSVNARAGDRAIELVLDEPAAISGRVVDERGAPIEAFTVDGVLQNDAGGRFRLPVPAAGMQELVIAAPGRAPLLHRVKVNPGSRRDLGTLVLGAPREVRGRVTESGSGAPIAGARVSVGRSLDQVNNRSHDGGSDLLATAVTDAAGRFAVAAPRGEVPLVVQHPRYQQSVVELTDGQDQVDASLERGATVRGRVLDAGGRPVEAAIFFDGPTPAMVRSLADGSYEASGLAAGDYQVGARRPQGPTWKVLPPREVAIDGKGDLYLELREL